MFVALLIFLATLVCVIWRPRNLGIGWIAMAGMVLALAAGVVSLDDVPRVWAIVWDATFTLVALILISLILDAAGFFEWAALHVARWGGGSGPRLFVLIILLGAVMAAFFANDGAVLILTPLVLEMLHALKFERRAALAFMLAVGFTVDATSLPLMISNLTNILTANYFHIAFTDYARVMVAVNFAALATTLVVLWLYFRKAIPPRFDVSALDSPRDAIRDPFVFYAGWAVLALLLAGYFLAHPLGVPVSAVAGGAALLLVLATGREHFPRRQSKAVIPLKTLLHEAPWQVVWFSLGMYLVVFGLHNHGVTALLGALLETYAQTGAWLGTLLAGTTFAALSALMNNLPTVMLDNLAIEHAQLAPQLHELFVYANVVGTGIGPKMTPLGSLATLLWLHVLEGRGMKVTWGEYLRTGMALTLPVLVVTLSALTGWLWLLGG
ncbi:MAG: arsenic transporter [Pseudomonadota bacterium]